MHAFDRRMDRQTELSSLDRVCIPCSAVKSDSDSDSDEDKKVATFFSGKNRGVTPSVAASGVTHPSDATARWSEIADSEPIFALSASAVTPSEKVQLTLIGSPLRAFQRA